MLSGKENVLKYLSTKISIVIARVNDALSSVKWAIDIAMDCTVNARKVILYMVLREIFGGKLERLTGGWRKLQWALEEWDLWCR